MSERSARREHDTFMQTVNLKRGSIAPAVRGQTFEDITNKWRQDVAPHLSASTVRQRESHLRYHILALTVEDLNFTTRTITVNKSVDDNNRTIGQTKTETSTALLPMSSSLATVLQAYLKRAWRENPRRLLFPNRRGTLPRRRDNVVKYGLQPVLRRLGIPTKFAGLHAFRHGLAMELADKNTPIPVLQKQMRHADIRTTLEVYAHVIPQSQRDVMERVSIGTVPVTEQEQTASASE